jgi:hypothetical protein
MFALTATVVVKLLLTDPSPKLTLTVEEGPAVTWVSTSVKGKPAVVFIDVV